MTHDAFDPMIAPDGLRIPEAITLDVYAEAIVPRATGPLREGRAVLLQPGQDALRVPTSSLNGHSLRLDYGSDIHRLEGHYDDLTLREKRAYARAFARLNGGALGSRLRAWVNAPWGGVSGWADALINTLREGLGLRPLSVKVPYVSPTQSELALRIAVTKACAAGYPSVDFSAVPAITALAPGYARLSFLGAVSGCPVHFHVLMTDEPHAFEVLNDEQYRRRFGR